MTDTRRQSQNYQEMLLFELQNAHDNIVEPNDPKLLEILDKSNYFKDLTKTDRYHLFQKMIMIDISNIKYASNPNFDKNFFKDGDYFKLCQEVLRRSFDGLDLEYIDASLLNDIEYESLCNIAFKKNNKTLKFIKGDRLTKPAYQAMCEEAYKNDYKLIKYMTGSNLDKVFYQDKYEEILKIHGPLSLKYINGKNLDPKKYEIFCTNAFNEAPEVFEHISGEFLETKVYEELSRKAMKSNPSYLAYISPKFVDFSFYLELCRSVFKYTIVILPHLKLTGLSKDEILTVYGEALKNDRNLSLIEKVNETHVDKDIYTRICIKAANSDYRYLKNVRAENFADKQSYVDLYINVISNQANAWSYFGYINLNSINKDDYVKIALTALSKNSNVLRFINLDKLKVNGVVDADTYYELCHTAVNQTGATLEDVKPEYLPAGKYDELCIAAVTKYAYAFQYIDFSKLSNKSNYDDLCLKVSEQNGLTLKYIKPNKLQDKTAFLKMMQQAVLQNGLALEYVKIENTPDKAFYQRLCVSAVAQNGLALQYYSYLDLLAYFKPTLDDQMNEFKRDRKFYTDLCETAVKQNPQALKFIVDDEIKFSLIKQLSVEKILETDCNLFKYFPKDKEINEQVINYFKKVRNVVIIDDADAADNEIKDSYLVYANREFSNDPKKSRKGNTIKTNKNNVKDILKMIQQSSIENNSNAANINLVLMSHFSENSTSIAGMETKDVISVLEKNPIVGRVTLLGCNTAKAEMLESEKQILQHYEEAKAKESHIQKCGFVLMARLPTDEEVKKILSKKFDAAYILVQDKENNKQEYKLIYATKGETIHHSLNEDQLKLFSQEFNNNKAFKFPGKKAPPLILQDSDQKPLQIDFDDRLYVNDICADNTTAYSKTHKHYKNRKEQTPYLSSIEVSVEDKEMDKISKTHMMYDLTKAIQSNHVIKQSVVVKGYTGVLSVDTKEGGFITSNEFAYKHTKYAASIFGDQTKDHIDRKILAHNRRKMLHDHSTSHAKSIKIKIPGKR